MTASSSEVMNAVNVLLDSAALKADSLGVSELLFLTVLRDQAEKMIRLNSCPTPTCDI